MYLLTENSISSVVSRLRMQPKGLVDVPCLSDCLSYSALQVLSRRCYGKQRCKITVNNHHFGRPCLPGVKKYLTVSYACGKNIPSTNCSKTLPLWELVSLGTRGIFVQQTKRCYSGNRAVIPDIPEYLFFNP